MKRRRKPNYSERALALGMRELTIRVPDTREPGFAEEARRQSLAVERSDAAESDQDLIDAISELD